MSRNARVTHRVDHARRSQHVHAVGSEAEGAAIFAQAIRCLEEVNSEASLLEEESQNRACHSATDDEYALWMFHGFITSFTDCLNY